MQIEFVVIFKILIFSSEYSIGATNWFRLIYHRILIFFFSLDFLVGEALQKNVFIVTKISEEIFFVAKNIDLVTKYEFRH